MNRNQQSAASAPAFKYKWLASLLGLFAGAAGLHRWYLGQRWWWLYPLLFFPLIGYALRQEIWFREPAFFLAAMAVVAACLETIIIGLTPAEKFDGRFNAGLAQTTRGGAIAVIIAVIALMGGAIVLMAVLSLVVEAVMVAIRG